MAVFLASVVVGWVITFALWFIWSFGLLAGLIWGAMAGTAAIFTFLLLQGLTETFRRPHDPGDVATGKNIRSEPDKAT